MEDNSIPVSSAQLDWNDVFNAMPSGPLAAQNNASDAPVDNDGPSTLEQQFNTLTGIVEEQQSVIEEQQELIRMLHSACTHTNNAVKAMIKGCIDLTERIEALESKPDSNTLYAAGVPDPNAKTLGTLAAQQLKDILGEHREATGR